MTGICKTASGLKSEGLEKRQLLPAVKETRFRAKGNILAGKKKARNLCSCCSSLNNPAKRGVMFSNRTLAGRRGGEGSKGKHSYPKGCVFSEIVSGDPGERKRGEK